MDNIFAIGLILLLLLRGMPFLLNWLAPRFARRLHRLLLRFQALVDIATGTMMLGFVVLLLWQREWILALLLAAISIPAFNGLIAGFRVLARSQ
jgi:hypothetical protein